MSRPDQGGRIHQGQHRGAAQARLEPRRRPGADRWRRSPSAAGCCTTSTTTAGKQGDDPTRPGFTRMLAEAGEFDVLIMRDLDRFSRKLAIYAAAVDDLLEAGVMLYEFEGDGTGLRQLNLDDEDDRALADVKAVFAQLEKAKTKRRVRQAVQARGPRRPASRRRAVRLRASWTSCWWSSRRRP